MKEKKRTKRSKEMKEGQGVIGSCGTGREKEKNVLYKK